MMMIVGRPRTHILHGHSKFIRTYRTIPPEELRAEWTTSAQQQGDHIENGKTCTHGTETKLNPDPVSSRGRDSTERPEADSAAWVQKRKQKQNKTKNEQLGLKEQLEYKRSRSRTLPDSRGVAVTLSGSESLASTKVYVPLPPWEGGWEQALGTIPSHLPQWVLNLYPTPAQTIPPRRPQCGTHQDTPGEHSL